MNISKEVYKNLIQESRRYKYLKYEATVEQWAEIANVESVEEVDQLLDLYIDHMWDNAE